ncbi:aminobenzoyl-glutamate utilization protein B [Devosia lucknowensis]|uniref:Aminobenzoyl-glutamate utilization protein B n=1 Tax=Devosia lucknowensis TaxID=1096929 RepID=A0A1Y6G824_9HYPH|nr:amidohydrolase [Devosia lucknowensis]SMQ85483.1 aminobenzoyl-glutamate utilization protein B [Devosia lucknowensis]
MDRALFDLLSGEIERLSPHFTALADDIWATPELCFEEHRSSAAQIAALEQFGFQVTRNVAGLETAFFADWAPSKDSGAETPLIAFLGEFDALPGLSQVAGIAEERPVTAGGNGHGCGHNLLGSGSMLAAVALAKVLDAHKIGARLRYYGCPAEEGGWGKAIMARAGVFDGVDIAIGWHPGAFNGVRARSTLAIANRSYRFRGKAAHAAMAPHLGRSALDALELMNIGTNFLREHMPQDARVHYAITDAGGIAPGVVQAQAEVLYMIRAPERDELGDLVVRVDDIARGAALMTGTEVDIVDQGGAANVIPNAPLCAAMHDVMCDLGRLEFTDDERDFAERIRATLPGLAASDRRDALQSDVLLGENDDRTPLHEGLRAYDGRMAQGAGSTDVGDVSWVVPVVECATATWAAGTPSHSWQVVAQGKSSAAHRAMARAAATMAGVGIKVILNSDLRHAARNDLDRRRAGR